MNTKKRRLVIPKSPIARTLIRWTIKGITLIGSISAICVITGSIMANTGGDTDALFVALMGSLLGIMIVPALYSIVEALLSLTDLDPDIVSNKEYRRYRQETNVISFTAEKQLRETGNVRRHARHSHR